ncbi:major facilitator superfamily MFS_1 [Alkaliphilus metalliredigens QYMF]|uniref:Major facilitator superfamily MFS_1 n=1 Tax=Alkaliphilus metalliredigens (strain QYMF) TaxID=293826 RepID=A6TUX0_ALKMQ|nr:OFA family MFS transporter [Alkaliphilus metalliredigens]ABR49988.1 major facilitator superfamily MFS_1 [Alkaliphilus metalliredigens QYMF]
MTELRGNRWTILIVSIIMNICIGAAYAWSVFQTPLVELLGSTTAEVSLAFTLSLALVPVSMMIFGRFQDKKGPRMITLLGSVIFGAGIYLTGLTNSVMMLYLTYGVLGGLGIGAVYGCTVANTVKWFPDKRGLAGGLVAAGFGSGAVILAPLAEGLINRYDVLTTFKLMGIIFFILIALCSSIIKSPQPGWKPKGWEPANSKSKTSINSGLDLSPEEMMKTGTFYILWVIYIIGAVSGLMIIGHASPIAQGQIGLTSSVAAICVSILALANTFGRIFWGIVSDRIGRYNTMALMFAVSASMLLVLNIADNIVLFIISTFGIALSFGGFLGIMPSVTADKFGAKSLGMNYGIIFTAYGVAAVVGPRIAAVAVEASGEGYSRAYIIASAMNVVGILCGLIMVQKAKKSNAKNVKAMELATDKI